MWKLCLSTKFPQQGSRWNYGIFSRSVSCDWSLSTPPTNIRKPLFFKIYVFRGYGKRPVAWNGLRECDGQPSVLWTIEIKCKKKKKKNSKSRSKYCLKISKRLSVKEVLPENDFVTLVKYFKFLKVRINF